MTILRLSAGCGDRPLTGLGRFRFHRSPVSVRHHRILFLVLLFLAFVSANILWLNPLPNQEPAFCPGGNSAFMCQFNSDSWDFFWAATNFPDHFKESATRIERPVMPFIVNMIGNLYDSIAVLLGWGDNELSLMMTPRRKVESMVFAFITYKMIIFIVGVWMLYDLLSGYMSPRSALLSVIVFLFHKHVIYMFNLFHSTDYEYLTPVYLAWSVKAVVRSIILRRHFFVNVMGVSLLNACLVLAKTNLAAYFAVIVFSLLHLRVFPVVMSGIFVGLVYGVYWIYLKIHGIGWYSTSAEAGQGNWFLERLHTASPWDFVRENLDSIPNFAGIVVDFHGIWLVPALVGVVIGLRGGLRKEVLFASILAGFVFLQVFAANRYSPYMTADFWFLTTGFGFIALDRALQSGRVRHSFLVALVVGWCASGVGSYVNLPLSDPLERVPGWQASAAGVRNQAP
ncbi:MAG: hypothetical protein HQL57_04625 [Magnetococcales bacterium]|nr:hypothetical protein [Magnetococcales bacterium]